MSARLGRERAAQQETLELVKLGLIGVADAIRSGAHRDAIAHMRIADVLAAAPGWSRDDAQHACRTLMRVCGSSADPAQATITWLYHRKADTARLAALADRIACHDSGPDTIWPGFPFTVIPEQAHHG